LKQNREERMGRLIEGFMGRLNDGVRPTMVNGDSVERSSVRGDLKHGEVKLGRKMEPVEGGILMGTLYRVGRLA
jgi:hypothetical protein